MLGGLAVATVVLDVVASCWGVVGATPRRAQVRGARAAVLRAHLAMVVVAWAVFGPLRLVLFGAAGMGLAALTERVDQRLGSRSAGQTVKSAGRPSAG